VVSKPHDIKGESAFAYVVLNVPRPEGAAAKSLVETLRGWVADQLSPIAKPDDIRLTDSLPKTRSGKIMRRLLRAIARGEEITQDMSTLENPGILDQLRGAAAPRKPPAKLDKAARPARKAAGKPKRTKARTQPRAKSKPKRTSKPKKPVSRIKRVNPKRRKPRSKK
jgi:hypothetical protein